MTSVAGQQDSIIVKKGISYALTDTTCQTKLATILGIKSEEDIPIQSPPLNRLKFQRKRLHRLNSFISRLLFRELASVLGQHFISHGEPNTLHSVVQLDPKDIPMALGLD